MLEVNAIVDADLEGLSPEAITTLAQRMLSHIREQQQHLQQRDERISHQAIEIAKQAGQIERKDAELRFKTARLEKINFELARLKAWKFGAKTEAMSAEQRRLFEETMAEDEASLQALLEQLQGKAPQDASRDQRRRPKRQALPGHLRRVEHHHEPEDTTCPTPGCGRQMVRIGHLGFVYEADIARCLRGVRTLLSDAARTADHAAATTAQCRAGDLGARPQEPPSGPRDA